MFRNSTLEMPCSVEKVLGEMFTKTLNFMGVDVSLSVIVFVLLCKTISLLHFLKKWKKNIRINGREKTNNIGATL